MEAAGTSETSLNFRQTTTDDSHPHTFYSKLVTRDGILDTPVSPTEQREGEPTKTPAGDVPAASRLATSAQSGNAV